MVGVGRPSTTLSVSGGSRRWSAFAGYDKWGMAAHLSALASSWFNLLLNVLAFDFGGECGNLALDRFERRVDCHRATVACERRPLVAAVLGDLAHQDQRRIVARLEVDRLLQIWRRFLRARGRRQQRTALIPNLGIVRLH